MRRPADFEQAVRRGARGGRDTVVVHLTQRTDPGPGPVVGFVVSKGVGNAVTRNLVKRRLRALVHVRLSGVPSSASLVVRALPASATASYSSLEQDLDGALATAQRRLARSAS
ncbi:ribonuclease P protein component [Cellulomonas rhizosphaerae]